jgi:hypothetical protein
LRKAEAGMKVRTKLPMGLMRTLTAVQCLLAGSLSLFTCPANAETVEITDDRGGFVFLYVDKWQKLQSQKVNVKIAGPCLSACTVLLGYIPRRDICVTPHASLGFHLATLPSVTKQLLDLYPDDINAWLDQHGGLSFQVLWMQAPEIFKYFSKCDQVPARQKTH